MVGKDHQIMHQFLLYLIFSRKTVNPLEEILIRRVD